MTDVTTLGLLPPELVSQAFLYAWDGLSPEDQYKTPIPVPGAGLAFGTAFPGTPATGDRFYRTDRAIQYFYDGTRWLSVHLHSISGQTLALVTAQTFVYMNNPHFGLSDIFIKEFSFSSQNNNTTAANFFTARLSKYSGASNTTIGPGVLSAQNDTQGQMIGHTGTIDEVVDMTIPCIVATFTETGAASAFLIVGFTYRLVG